MALIPLGLLSAAGGGAIIGAGYFGFGADGLNTQTVNKYSFPTDTRSVLSLTTITWASYYGTAADNNVSGYFGGGNVSGNRIWKIIFSTDTPSTLVATLSSSRDRLAGGFSNTGVAGYFAGGQVGSTAQTTVDRLAFPAETRSTLGTGLSSARTFGSGFENARVAGYVAGGFTTVHITGVDKYALPAETRTTLATGISVARRQLAGMANAGVAGYVGGGSDASVRYSTVDKFAFPADTRTTLATGLSSGRNRLGAMADSGVAGYFGGGGTTATSGEVTTVDKFAFPSDTRSTLGTGLDLAKSELGGFASSTGLG
jgi:hypothetical protein